MDDGEIGNGGFNFCIDGEAYTSIFSLLLSCLSQVNHFEVEDAHKTAAFAQEDSITNRLLL